MLEIYLTHEPLHRAAGDNRKWWEATALDNKGNHYTVYWEIQDNICNWDKFIVQPHPDIQNEKSCRILKNREYFDLDFKTQLELAKKSKLSDNFKQGDLT